ncbi:MAG: hypothetical protein AB7P17_07485 [Nitrospirales bacterium]|nr:hypothetical protein [Nitrospirales bacterium]
MTFLIMVLVYISLIGCMSTPDQSQKIVSEGSGGPMPPPGTRMMILSNHKGAQNGAAEWLQQRGFFVVDPSRVEKELTDFAAAVASGGERNLQITEVAKAVDADMVVSAHVGRKFVPADFGSQAMTITSVEIQGMDVQTGNVAFESKAWNSDPVVASEGTVLSLTKGALQQAWKGEGNLVMAPVDVVAQERLLDSGVIESRSADANIEKSQVAPPTQSSANSSNSKGDPGEKESSLGLQVASGALSILYTPFKVVYAGLGGIIGGLAYVMTAGNERVAQSIWDVSLEGDYWVKPSHLEGDESLHFQGQSKTPNVVH